MARPSLREFATPTNDDGPDQMRCLADLLQTPKDRDYLSLRGVFVDVDAFEAELRPVAPCETLGALESLQGQTQSHIIWAGQQLYVDYRRSVTDKLTLLAQLGQKAGTTPFFLCVDTDRSGSDKAITAIHWPLPDSIGKLRVVKARDAKHAELRFVNTDVTQRQEVIRLLKCYLKQTVNDFERAMPLFERVEQVFLEEEPISLATFNLNITRLLMEHLGVAQLPTLLLSDFLAQGCLTTSINRWLNHREPCIAAFNEAVAELEGLDIGSPVKPLPDDYLPLNYSCDVDHSRFKLRYERQGSEHFAVGQSQAGKTYRFSLGRDTLDIQEVAQTGRWSPDVCTPIFLNQLVSGYVVGKSSALYGMVLNRVLERGLGQRPVPMIVPDFSSTAPPEHDSALFAYLTQ